MLYIYKAYPNSALATILSAIGSAMFVVTIFMVSYWLVYNFSDIISGTFVWNDSIGFVIVFTIIFSAIGGIFKLFAFCTAKITKKIHNKAQQNPTDTTETKKPAVKEFVREIFTSEQMAEKYLNKQLKQKTLYTVLLLIFIGLMVFSGLKGYVMPYDDTVDAKAFNKQVSDSSANYSDIIMVSDWFYGIGGSVYYFARDKDDQIMIVRLSQADFAKCEPQYNFSLSNGEGDMPPPIRLYGRTRKITSEMDEYAGQALGLSGDEYRSHMGTSYFDVTDTPAQANASQWRKLFWWMTVLTVALGFFWMTHFIARRKSIKQLKKQQMSILAANELSALGGLGFDDADKVRCSEHFIFSKNASRIIAISDILLCYIFNLNNTKSAAILTVGTKDINKKPIGRYSGFSSQPQRILSLICQHNPSVITEFTPENDRKFNEMRKEK